MVKNGKNGSCGCGVKYSLPCIHVHVIFSEANMEDHLDNYSLCIIHWLFSVSCFGLSYAWNCFNRVTVCSGKEQCLYHFFLSLSCLDSVGTLTYKVFAWTHTKKAFLFSFLSYEKVMRLLQLEIKRQYSYGRLNTVENQWHIHTHQGFKLFTDLYSAYPNTALSE